jgi:DNA polymerase-3 subunit delta'
MATKLIGNVALLARLEDKLRAGRLPHAMIFSGPEGVGKRTAALGLVRALNCSEPGAACEQCVSCRKILRGVHPDVQTTTLLPEASEIKVEQIRELRSRLSLQPSEGRVHACLIDPAGRLSAGAANALLKVLEEPPPATFFFLVATNAADLLTTVRSRCQIYQFAPLPLDAIKALGITDELVARWARGSIGWAQTADPEALRQTRDEMLAFLEAGITRDPAALAKLIGQKLAPDREQYAELMRAASVLLSDVLYLKLGMEDRIVNVDVRQRLDLLAATAPMETLLEGARQIGVVEQNLRRYLNAQLMTDNLLVSLASAPLEG